MASSSDDWITVTSGNSGYGNGIVNYSVDDNIVANSSTDPRSGTITIAGYTFFIDQEGISCSYGISPTSDSLTSVGGAGSVSVTASPDDCSWTATSNDSWITVVSGDTGNGNGSVDYTVEANSTADASTDPRMGTVSIAGHIFTVTQSGLPVITGPASLVNATDGAAYGPVSFTASGTVPITWSITAGSLPTGMTLAPDGT
ncbi:MAG: hypothetical protein GWN30_05735, partial [Gammaproteobacteria bacterium]|nr:hypothetical protein [Gammaproteobacteria bacterium]NIX01580.1 hypothetical protein [Phycisphaerae bacterium]